MKKEKIAKTIIDGLDLNFGESKELNSFVDTNQGLTDHEYFKLFNEKFPWVTMYLDSKRNKSLRKISFFTGLLLLIVVLLIILSFFTGIFTV